MKKYQLVITITVGLLLAAAIGMPGLSQANITANGTATVTWDSVALSNTAGLDWTVGTGLDMRGSLSGVQAWLYDISMSDWTSDTFDGAWVSTAASLSMPLASPTPNVTGSASTNVPVISGLTTQTALSSIDMGSPLKGGVDIAEAVLMGQFTLGQFIYNPIDPLTGQPAIDPLTGLPGVFVPGTTPMLLDVLVDYTLGIDLFNNLSNNSNTTDDVSVGLTLSDFDTDTVLWSDSRYFSRTLVGMGSDTFSDFGQFHLSYLLQPGINYDFEVQASTAAFTAPVPEPASLLLIISGLVGLGIFRKRFA